MTGRQGADARDVPPGEQSRMPAPARADRDEQGSVRLGFMAGRGAGAPHSHPGRGGRPGPAASRPRAGAEGDSPANPDHAPRWRAYRRSPRAIGKRTPPPPRPGRPASGTCGPTTTSTGSAPPPSSASTTSCSTVLPASGRASLGCPMRVLRPAAGTTANVMAALRLDDSAAPLRTAASGPRLRKAISSATMLTAISWTLFEPMSSPTGARTRARSSGRAPWEIRSPKMSRTFRLLPSMPT